MGGAPQTISIEIVALSLESVSPINVTGSPPSQWDIQVVLSGTAIAPASNMIISHQTANGGTYDSTLHVCPFFTFTRTSSPFDTRTFDLCDAAFAPVLITTLGSPWTHTNIFRPEGPHMGPHPDATPFPPSAVSTLGLGALTLLGSLMMAIAFVYRRRMHTA